MMFHNAPYANELGYSRNACVTIADVALDNCDFAIDPPVPPPPRWRLLRQHPVLRNIKFDR